MPTARAPTPVILPPGRPRLATKAKLRPGRRPTTKTIGIVVVAALAASAVAVPSIAGDHSHPTLNQIGSHDGQSIVLALAPSDIRSRRCGPRHSRLQPDLDGTHAIESRLASGDAGLRNPITGIAGCCARAASGHAATAAPPNSVHLA